MNWYIALGIKIFVVIMLIFQAIIVLCLSADWLTDWITFNENDKKLLSIVITIVLLFSLTIPIVCWIFNL